MGFRVAVASDNALFVNQHFSRTRFYYIYELGGGEIRYSGIRENLPAASEGHDTDRLSGIIDLLSDCQAVLVSQIGPGADKALARRQVKTFVVPGAPVREALEKLQRAEGILFPIPATNGFPSRR